MKSNPSIGARKRLPRSPRSRDGNMAAAIGFGTALAGQLDQPEPTHPDSQTSQNQRDSARTIWVRRIPMNRIVATVLLFTTMASGQFWGNDGFPGDELGSIPCPHGAIGPQPSTSQRPSSRPRRLRELFVRSSRTAAALSKKTTTTANTNGRVLIRTRGFIPSRRSSTAICATS